MKWISVCVLLLLVAAPVQAQMMGGSGVKSGNVVAFYDQSYFGTIDATTITAGAFISIKPFRTTSGADSLGNQRWGNRIRLEIQCDDLATAGSASIELYRCYGLSAGWDGSTYTASVTTFNNIQLPEATPLNMATKVAVNVTMADAVNFGQWTGSSVPDMTVLDESSAVAALKHTIQYLELYQRRTTSTWDWMPLPPVLQIFFDRGTGTWTAGTVKVRVWVYAE